ncbi:MAG: hypothetical protein HYS86_00995 [Candidatus Chisholmbacteria bacterium]|nr:hypothetical protein [Candidatus Chisholmbacteria bacterium]
MFKKIVSFVTVLTLALDLAALPVLATTVEISGNGAESQSVATVTQSQQSSISQSNEGDVNNNVNIDANTGNNTASDNTGDTSITTGDIHTNTAITNDLNQSQASAECCPQGATTLIIKDNGANSQNTITATTHTSAEGIINQTATINNTVQGNANTGYNTANDNHGTVSITTGNIFIHEKIANKHVNQAIMTLPQDAGPNVSARISDNGQNTTNTITHNYVSLVNAVVNNVAEITNKSHWSANTGGNDANDNFGHVSIDTGDILVWIDIQNDVNYSQVEVGCCEAKPSPTPTPPPGPVPSPPPGRGGNGGGGDGDGGNGAAAAGGNGGGQILPVTGNNLLLTLTFINLLLLTFGLYLKTPPNRELKLTFSFA